MFWGILIYLIFTVAAHSNMHAPLRTIVISVFLVSAWPWILFLFDVDIAHGRSFLRISLKLLLWRREEKSPYRGLYLDPRNYRSRIYQETGLCYVDVFPRLNQFFCHSRSLPFCFCCWRGLEFGRRSRSCVKKNVTRTCSF